MIKATLKPPLIIGLLFIFLLSSCAHNKTYKNVQIKNVRVGQTVSLYLNDGSKLKFEVTRIDNNYIYGGPKSVALENIDRSELVIENSKPDFFLFAFFWEVSAVLGGISSLF